MLTANQPCFIAIPNPQNRRVLIPGNVTNLDGDASCQVAFEEPLTVAPGEEVSLFARWQNQFHQQSAKVRAVESRAGKPLITFERVGRPVNSESRSCDRVNTGAHRIPMTVGPQTNCILADVSVDGISAIVAQPLMVGMMVDIELLVNSVLVRGQARVQSEKTLESGRLRYGLYVTDKQLGKSVQTLAGLLQWQQLQRRRGAA